MTRLKDLDLLNANIFERFLTWQKSSQKTALQDFVKRATIEQLVRFAELLQDEDLDEEKCSHLFWHVWCAISERSSEATNDHLAFLLRHATQLYDTDRGYVVNTARTLLGRKPKAGQLLDVVCAAITWSDPPYIAWKKLSESPDFPELTREQLDRVLNDCINPEIKEAAQKQLESLQPQE